MQLELTMKELLALALLAEDSLAKYHSQVINPTEPMERVYASLSSIHDKAIELLDPESAQFLEQFSNRPDMLQ